MRCIKTKLPCFVTVRSHPWLDVDSDRLSLGENFNDLIRSVSKWGITLPHHERALVATRSGPC